MMKIFISCERIDESPIQTLVTRLCHEGWYINHSPRNPIDGCDPRWEDWYKQGLPETLNNINVFIIAITLGWDSSTWMGIEADYVMGLLSKRHVPGIYYWNPYKINVKGMLYYLREELPLDLETLVRTLKASDDKSTIT